MSKIFLSKTLTYEQAKWLRGVELGIIIAMEKLKEQLSKVPNLKVPGSDGVQVY